LKDLKQKTPLEIPKSSEHFFIKVLINFGKETRFLKTRWYLNKGLFIERFSSLCPHYSLLLTNSSPSDSF